MEDYLNERQSWDLTSVHSFGTASSAAFDRFGFSVLSFYFCFICLKALALKAALLQQQDRLGTRDTRCKSGFTRPAPGPCGRVLFKVSGI